MSWQSLGSHEKVASKASEFVLKESKGHSVVNPHLNVEAQQKCEWKNHTSTDTEMGKICKWQWQSDVAAPQATRHGVT